MKILILLLFLSINSLSYAHKFYVSTSGNNANDGLTTATPWQTVQYAEENATSAGDTIALKRGETWNTALAIGIHHGGTVGNPIIWDGALWGTGANAIINPNFDGSDILYYSAVNIRACSNVTFQNITVDVDNHNLFGIVIGSYNAMSSAPTQNSETNIIVQDCSVFDCGRGVFYCLGILVQTWNNDMSNITIQRNTVDGVGAEAISLYMGRTNIGANPKKLTNCYIGYNAITNFGRSGSLGVGIQINNKCTDVIIENNIINTGANGKGFGITVESNEPELGYFPTGVIIRYNKVTISRSNDFCIFIQSGQAKTVDCYCNTLIQGVNTTDTNGGGVWVAKSDSPTWVGAILNFYNNTIYTAAGRSFQNDCAIAGVVTLKNNIIYNTGNSDYGNYCLITNTAGATTHSNNSFYRSVNANYTKIKDGGSYKQSNTQVLSWEATAIVTDPLFVTPGSDFHLQAGSPAIGAGIVIPGVTKDIEGVTFNDHPNIGCFQSPANLGPPIYLSSSIEEATPNILEIIYDHSLANIIPAATAFNVQVNSESRTLNSVAIVDGKVQLTLASAIGLGDKVTVSYTKPAINPLQTPSGEQAASNSAQLVTNKIITSILPIYNNPIAQDTSHDKIKMTIYPNPAHEIIHISFECTSTFSLEDTKDSAQIIRIFDMSGKLVIEKMLESDINDIQISINLKSGLYNVLLVSSGFTISSRKIMVL